MFLREDLESFLVTVDYMGIERSIGVEAIDKEHAKLKFKKAFPGYKILRVEESD